MASVAEGRSSGRPLLRTRTALIPSGSPLVLPSGRPSSALPPCRRSIAGSDPSAKATRHSTPRNSRGMARSWTAVDWIVSDALFSSWRPLMAAQQAREQRRNPTTRRGRRFQPGQSGNPKGRPAKGTTIAECIRSLGGENGAPYVQRLHAIAFGDNVRAALSAIAVLPSAATARCRRILVPIPMLTFRMSDQDLNAEILRLAADITARKVPSSS